MRERIPDRRPNVTRDIDFGGSTYTVCIGLSPKTGMPAEVFVDGFREGSQMEALLSDAAVIASLALQHGATPDGLSRSLGRVPVPWRGEDAEDWASPIGAVVGVLVEVAAEIEAGAAA